MFLYSNGAKLRILYYKQFLDDRRIAGLITIVFWRMLGYVCIVGCIYYSF